ncbi:MAG TPA: histidine phosphatase family protein [Cyanobacteria bacterium UBA8803]|nr:histidine phosphatase family protein [Cyanobacteria bacterium UBA8803]
MSSPNPGTRVIIVRHGRSTYNEQGRYQGSCDDSVLTEKGHNSAYQTGLALKGININAIYTSPLKRAQQTTYEILSALSTATDNLPSLHIADQLKEINLPAWQGLFFTDVQEQFPEAYRCWRERPHQFQMNVSQPVEHSAGNLAVASPSPQQCFPLLDLYEQARQFWQQILPRHPGQTVVIVSHGGTNRALISTAIGLKPDRYHTLQQSNCGLSVLNFPAGCHQPARLEALNLTVHLGKTLPKLKEGHQGLRLILVSSESTDPEQMQKLTQLLKAVAIDFSISSINEVGSDRPWLDTSPEITQQILENHPTTLQLQVLREDFPLIWQQAIYKSFPATPFLAENASSLMTGLVVARDASLKRLLSQILGLSTDKFACLPLHPGAIGVIHYPSTNHPPILQGLNIQELCNIQQLAPLVPQPWAGQIYSR